MSVNRSRVGFMHATLIDVVQYDSAHRLFSPNARRAGIFFARPFAITIPSIADVAAQRDSLRSVQPTRHKTHQVMA